MTYRLTDNQIQMLLKNQTMRKKADFLFFSIQKIGFLAFIYI